MELREAHKIIFQHLKDLNAQDPEFRFILSVYPSMDNISKVSNRRCLLVSFWSMDSQSYHERSVPIFLLIDFDKKNIIFRITAEEGDNKMGNYFKKMAKKLGFKYNPLEDTKHNWEKPFVLINQDYIKLIDDFIRLEKNNIDNYVREEQFKEPIIPIPIDFFEISLGFNEAIINVYLDKNKQQDRPCVLKYLKVDSFQSIKSLIIKDLPNDAQWIFLTGENGFGKTSVLRAIAKSMLGDEDRVKQVNEDTKILSFVNAEGKSFFHKVKKGNVNTLLPYIVLGYGVARFNLSENNGYGQAYSLFENDGRLLSIEKLLTTADDNTFDKIKQVFKTIIPNLADIKKVSVGGFYKIQYQEKSENGDTFDPVELDDLAAGYRGIITMIGDMLAHFLPQVSSYLNPSDVIEGIVIIDEFDAHLHPKYQYELPSLLSKAFPKVQFIVSTHSPIPILGVEPKTAVVLTVNRTKEEGITVERLDDDIDISRLSANALLTSDIFGFKTIFARGSTPDTIEPFDNYEDIKEMNEMEKLLELKNGLKNLKIKI